MLILKLRFEVSLKTTVLVTHFYLIDGLNKLILQLDRFILVAT